MATTSPLIIKDANAVLDYTWDWAAEEHGRWLEGDEVITSSTFIVPDGLTLVAHSFTDTTATVWLAGGTVDEEYRVVNRITTSRSPRSDDRSRVVRVIEK